MSVPWQITGTSVLGSAHHKTAQPCQDSYQCATTMGGTLLIVVADGAGSAARADEGARWVVNQAVAELCDALDPMPPNEEAWQQLYQQLYRNVINGLRAYAASQQQDELRQFATTLTCVAVTPTATVAAAQIGDGVVVIQTADAPETLQALSQPQRGEYANQTAFLTMENALDFLTMRYCSQPISALAVMTDGLLRLAINMASNQPHGPFFKPLWEFAHHAPNPAEAVHQLSNFLASERVCARTDDDKTLILAVQPRPAQSQSHVKSPRYV